LGSGMISTIVGGRTSGGSISVGANRAMAR
jgi:hypothetical protein